MAALVILLLALLVAAPGRADTGSTLGDRTGEGSTAFTGIALAPEANLFTGSLTTGIPIEVPTGRGAMTPQLLLQYSSSGGPGAFGHGWDLPLGRIERSSTWGVPRCGGAHTDDFVLVLPGGATELVREAAGSAFYRPRVEQAWVRAERREAENQWRVVDRSGRRYTFGDVDSARVATGTPPVFLQPAADGTCHFTAVWALTRIEDPNGNTIDIAWSKVFNTLYPSSVAWGGHPGAGIEHVYSVRFGVEWRAGDDRPISHRLGVRARLALRVAAIHVETRMPAPGTPVRSYTLAYDDPDTGVQSLLAAVGVTGRPTQHFLYTPAAVGQAETTITLSPPAGAYRMLRSINASQEVSQTVLDMNGDGLLDLVRSDRAPAEAWEVWWGEVTDQGTRFTDAPTAWAVPGRWQHLRNISVDDSSCGGTGWRCTRSDTVDLTGDGVPDFVDASTTSWAVYPGRGVPQWGFGAPIAWQAPYKFLRRGHGGNVQQDVLDMNGDGLPDLVRGVSSGQGAPHSWLVYLNTGSGFEAQPLPRWDAPVAWPVEISVTGDVLHRLIDFNGDGLPDLVRAGIAATGTWNDERCARSATEGASCLEVYFNTGQGFGAMEPPIPVPVSFGIQQFDNQSTTQDLFDVNGDGLPDWLYRRLVWGPVLSYESSWRVLLNRGGTLEPIAFVPHPTGFIEALAPRVWDGSGPEFFRRSADASSAVDLLDVNGDGFLDHVTGGAEQWTVRLNATGERPNLLAVMENGLGGTNSVGYRPSTAFDNTGGDAQPDLPFINWVVDRMRRSDGLCTPPAGADPYVPGPGPLQNPCIDAGHELVTTFQYADGRYDAAERVFRGFRYVVRVASEGSGAPPSHTATTFAQDPAAAGRILQVDTYAGDRTLVRREQNLWGTRDVTAERSQIWLAEHRQVVFDAAGGVPRYTATATDAPDAYGNITHHWTEGLFGAARVDTWTEYAQPTAGAEVYDKPSRVEIRDAGGVLDEQWIYYDGSSTTGLDLGLVSKGNVKRLRRRLSPTEPAGPETRIEYDPVGNPLRVTDANGRVTTTTYDDVLLFPRTVTDALQFQTETRFDYRWGQPIHHTDVNGVVTELAYDAAGRPTCSARPGDSLAECSTRRTYHFATTPGALSWVEIAQRQDGRPPLWTRHYFDALGRPRYSDSARVVDGQPTVVRSNHVEYDPASRVRRLYHPYPASAASPNNGAVVTDYHLDGGELIDPLGRPHQITNSDSTTRRTRYRGALTQSWDEEDHLTESLVDPHGREVERRVWQGAAVAVTRRQVYDGLGRVLEELQNGVVLRRSAYDCLGRRTTMIDADSGTWRYGYDGVGNLRWQDDPHPQRHIQMCYDAIHRPTRRCVVAGAFTTLQSCAAGCADPEQVRYEYDTATVPYARRRPTRITDASGSTEILAYDARGRRRAVRKTIDVDGVRTQADFAYAYDTNDRVTAITYPDGEVVRTEYDDAGQPIALYNQANAFYVTDARYDLLGRPTLVQHANGIADTRTYGGAADRYRLRALRSAPPTGAAILDLTYPIYSPRGLLRAVGDGREPAGERSNAAQYDYDALGRLTAADSAHDAIDQVFAYDGLGNLVRNGDRVVSFADPTRPHQPTAITVGAATTSVGHDANGNRARKGTQTYGYDAFERLARVDAGDRTVRFVHDADGRQVARVLEAAAFAQTRFYDRLVEVTEGWQTKSYYLGPLRVASQTNQSVGWQLVAAPGGGIVTASVTPLGPRLLVRLGTAAAGWSVLALVVLGATVFRAGRPRRAVVGVRIRPGHALLVAGLAFVAGLPWPLQVAPAAAGGYGPAFTPVRHYHTDHLGSTQAITDGAGVVIEQIRYLPYGGVRGRWTGSGARLSASTSLVAHEFTGYQLEPVSGLSYAGARFYDPELGSFLTQDPRDQFSSPYSYGGGDPLNWTDPDGRAFWLFVGALAVAAFANAGINAAIAAAEGAPLRVIGKAAIGGAISGAVGVGLGVAVSAATLGAAAASGTLAPGITMAQVGEALAGVAWRSAFSTTFANGAGQSAAAAGAPGELATFISVAAGYIGSVAFDQTLAHHFSGPIERAGQNGAQMCSNTPTHSDITEMAASDAGFSAAEAAELRTANLLRDRDVWNNEGHFDYEAQRAAGSFTKAARDLRGVRGQDFLEAAGSASHHVQDQYALGHLFPGTSALAGPYGAPLRFLIHNTIGGEITFRQASYDATLRLFQDLQPLAGAA